MQLGIRKKRTTAQERQTKKSKERKTSRRRHLGSQAAKRESVIFSVHIEAPLFPENQRKRSRIDSR